MVCCVGSPRTGRRGGSGRRERKPEEREQSGQTTERLTHTANMPNFEGTWKMKSSMNFDELLKALGEDNLILLI